MALIVSSMFSTCPCFTPLLLARPNPRISSLPNSFFLPAMTAILVVPMSRPTIMGCSLFIVCVLVVCLLLVTGYELWVTGYELRVTGCGLWVTGYGLRVAGLRVMSYGLRVMGYGFCYYHP